MLLKEFVVLLISVTPVVKSLLVDTCHFWMSPLLPLSVSAAEPPAHTSALVAVMVPEVVVATVINADELAKFEQPAVFTTAR